MCVALLPYSYHLSVYCFNVCYHCEFVDGTGFVKKQKSFLKKKITENLKNDEMSTVLLQDISSGLDLPKILWPKNATELI